MNCNSIRRRVGALVAAVLCSSLPWAASAAWPEKPIRILLGYAPGGASDLAARVVAEHLQRKYGQAVTIENKAGAGGRLATDAAAKADPDGYTLVLLVGADAVIAATDPKIPYNLLRDLQFVSMITEYPFILITAAGSKLKSVPQMLELAKKSPAGTVQYTTPGRGTTPHLAGELLAAMAGVDLTDIPYRGSSSAMTDVMSGRVDFTIAAIPSVQAYIQQGKLRAIGVTSKTRAAATPTVPAVAETIPGYEVTTWAGLAAPAKTPKAIVDKLSQDIRDVMKIKEVHDRFIEIGFDPLTGTSAEMRARVESDIAKWKQLVSTRKIEFN